jgi:hypothetical protein
MTDQILLMKPYADSRVISPKHPVSDEFDQALRIYRDSPFTITVQVRTRKGTQKRISTATVTKQEAKDIAAYLLRVAEELSEEHR